MNHERRASSACVRRSIPFARPAAVAIVAAAAALSLADPHAAEAAGGRYLLQIGKLSDGTPTNVDPAAELAGLNVNNGAGWTFGVRASYKGETRTFGFAPPPGTTAISSKVWPYVRAYGSPANQTWGEVTSSWGSWNIGGSPGNVSVDGLLSQGGTGLTAGGAGTATAKMPSVGGGDDTPAEFLVDKLDVTLSDDYDPEVESGPAPQALFGAPPASGWYTGERSTVVVTLSDRGGGVRFLLLRDGVTVHRYPVVPASATCRTFDTGQVAGNSYTTKAPCPTASVSYSVPVDLTELGDGVREIQLGAQDAGGNQRFATVHPVRINARGGSLPDEGSLGPGGCVYAADGVTCVPPAGGGGAVGGSGSAVGAAAGGGGPSTAPAAPGLPAAPAGAPAPARPCNGDPCATTARITMRAGRRGGQAVTVAYGRPVRLVGRLLTPGGTAIGGATIGVSEGTGPGARHAVVRTDRDGAFAYTAAAGRSRRVSFAYRAHADDQALSARFDARLLVRTGVRLRTDRRATRNRRPVTFLGRVLAAPARSRKLVELQAHSGGRWVTFGTARTAHGRFRYRYRFTRTYSTQTYRFRAVVKAETGWPWATGASNRVHVTVRGA